MDEIQEFYAKRIGGRAFGTGMSTYKFEMIKRLKRETAAKNPGKTIIDMGVGEPDEPADPGIVAVLAAEAGKCENRRYADNGIAEFQTAAAGYLRRVYGVTITDPLRGIVHGIGSKPVLAMLPLAFIDPGDYALMTVPGYPVLGTYTRYLGGKTFNLPLLPKNGFFPDFSIVPRTVLGKTKLLYLNYPNNPTGRCATAEFFSRTVEFARRHGIIIVHDASYSSLVYDGARPLSLLSIDGADELTVELFSLSKAFNMTGWRLAFAAGNPKLVAAYAAVKDNTDSGQFRAIQKAGIYALEHPELTERTCGKYSRRFDLLVAALRECGFDAVKPGGTFYCYVPAPAGTAAGAGFANAAEAAAHILKNCLISTVPEDDAGPCLRFSVTFEAAGELEEKNVIQTVKERLLKEKFVFA